MPNLIQANILSFLAVCGAVLMLAGCVSGKTSPDTYISPSGAVTSIETDRESCVSKCNADFERCSDREASAPSPYGSLAQPQTFSVQSDCRDRLRRCLDSCRSR